MGIRGERDNSVSRTFFGFTIVEFGVVIAAIGGMVSIYGATLGARDPQAVLSVGAVEFLEGSSTATVAIGNSGEVAGIACVFGESESEENPQKGSAIRVDSLYEFRLEPGARITVEIDLPPEPEWRLPLGAYCDNAPLTTTVLVRGG